MPWYFFGEGGSVFVYIRGGGSGLKHDAHPPTPWGQIEEKPLATVGVEKFTVL
jgi:hypothetical protein